MFKFLFMLLVINGLTENNWTVAYSATDIVISYKENYCGTKPHLFIQMNNTSQKELITNFDLTLKDQDGKVLFSRTDMYFELSPGIHNNDCDSINDQQLAIELPEMYKDFTIELTRKL